MILRITDGEGKVHQFRAPEWGDLSLGQWKAFRRSLPTFESQRDMVDDLLLSYQLAAVYAGIPEHLLRKMPTSELSRLFDVLSSVTAGQKAAEDDKAVVPTSVSLDGVTYTVPRDIGEGITFGQLQDITARLQKVEDQHDSLNIILAGCLVPEGKEYDGDRFDDRAKAMDNLSANNAVRITAFFFVGNDELRTIWASCIGRRLNSLLQASAQDLTDLLPAMDPSAPSSEPQGSSL